MKRVLNENPAWLSYECEVGGPWEPTEARIEGLSRATGLSLVCGQIVDWLDNGKKGKKMRTTIETNGRENRVPGAGTLAKCTEFCRAAARKLKQVEEQLIRKLTAETQGSVPQRLIQQAVNEAEALAWSTPYPLLFLPELAQEKIRSARQWNRRQQEIYRR